MKLTSLALPDIMVMTPKLFFDERGVFTETYSKRRLAQLGIDVEFVQDNHAVSMRAGTVRGLHFQIPPFAQDKLVRVLRGRILDVVVDIRRGSPSFGKSVSVELSAEDWTQIFVPKGYAHGLCTLEDGTEVLYKTSDFYSPECERGILWNDPDLGIDWPVGGAVAALSDKDRALPRLKDARDLFAFAPDG